MSLIKLKNNALDNLTSFEGSASLGDMVLVSSATASSSASIEFSLGSYKEYKFFFVNIHPQTDNVTFQMNFSTDNGSNYNVTKTTTYWRAYHDESDTGANIDYQVAQDLAQSTSDQPIAQQCGNDNDQNTSGMLHLYNPSSTTYVKHFLAKSNHTTENNYNLNIFVAGYANTTSAINAIIFRMSSGNIDDGIIKMYGVK